MVAGACNFLPKISLYYIVIMYSIVKTSTLQNFSTLIIFDAVQPSPSERIIKVYS